MPWTSYVPVCPGHHSDQALAISLTLIVHCAALQIYLWAPIYRENWSAFAPDFEELEENREYVEREDEFDINERPEDRALALAEEAATTAGEGFKSPPHHVVQVACFQSCHL